MGIFGGFSGYGARVGFEYNIGTDLDLDAYGSSSTLTSLYGNYALSFVEGLSIVLKYDMLDRGIEDDATTTGEGNDESVNDNETAILVGVIYQCSEGLTVSPNMLKTGTTNVEDTFSIKAEKESLK